VIIGMFYQVLCDFDFVKGMILEFLQSIEESKENSLMPVLAGTATALLTLGLAAVLAVILKNKSRRKSSNEIFQAIQVSDSNENDLLQIDNVKIEPQDTYDLVNNFEDVNQILESDLKKNLSEKIRALKTDINVRKQELSESLTEAVKIKKSELQVANAKYRDEIDSIEQNYKDKVQSIQIDYRADILRMRNSLKNLKVVLSDSIDEQSKLEKGRQELECPVCLELMKPPRRIWQCSEGHPVCEFCRKKPEVTCCPMCKHYFIGRSTIAEKIARAVFGDEEKVTLTGYKQIKP